MPDTASHSLIPANRVPVARTSLDRLLMAALVPSGVALAWLISKLAWFWSHRADLQFGWVVLFLCAYLVWDAWQRKPNPAFRWTYGGVVGLGMGCGLLFTVQIYQAAFGTNAASMCALACGILLFVFSNLHYVFGWLGVKHFAFSILFLLVAVPLPSMIYNSLVVGLQSKIALATVEILRLLGIPAQQSGSLIQLPSCTVGIDEACSGIRSLQSTVMATLFIGWLTLRRISTRAILFFAGIMLAVLGNLARSLFLSLTANAKGVEAIGSYHDAAGWSVLTFTAFGVILVSWMLGRLEAAVMRQQGEAPITRDRHEASV
ncbi:MAG: exosortase/archaeosortase family protein [Limisphaerales bacterium]